MTAKPVLLAALLASLLALAGSAQAIYIATPLRLDSDAVSGDPGDTIDFAISPENETTRDEWRGRSVVVLFVYDPDERAQPDERTSSDRMRGGTIAESLVLDERASGRFSWTIPDEADGHNVQVRVESEEGDLLAVRDVAVGDAPPVMRILAGGSGDDGREPAPIGNENGRTDAPPADGTRRDEPAGDDVPAAGLLAVLAVGGAAALALRQRG
ncbi:MAG TPA: hypothetical protein VM582_07140 [Candidatus Thermoplasmatota archaeon]|nr:hypothetical protein [Candidatus Thermoplasmatota archaeon]